MTLHRCLGLFTPLLALSLLLGTGCAGPTDEETPSAATGGAFTSVPEYDAIIEKGTKVEANSTPTAEQSASTHLVGWIPRVLPGAAVKQLLTVARWPEVHDAAGWHPFTTTKVVSDSNSGDTRKLSVKLTLDGGVNLDVSAVATERDTGITVRIVNTSAYKVFPLGTILEPEKLVMDLKLIAYQDGTIVDATTTVKLKKMEDRAPPLTASITAIFDWLKSTAR